MSNVVEVNIDDSIATIALNDPDRRNAMSLAMFDALDEAIARMANEESVHVVLIQGKGDSFCAGFDLAAAVDEPDLLAEFINRLSKVIRALRRLPQVVVVSVQGAAVAGGCAILSACDFVIAAPDAKLGYPVHRIGISPAVSLPTLRMAIGDGNARSLYMGGELIDGVAAARIGLVTHLADSRESLNRQSGELCRDLAKKPTHAMRTTKAWLNELDGSLNDSSFDLTASDTANKTRSEETQTLLSRWKAKTQA